MSITKSETIETESPKRVQMLEAARELFTAQGYGAVSMDAVARGAGVSKATLYAHFSSKDQLFATIIGDACRQNIADDGFMPAFEIASQADVRVALMRFGKRMVGFFMTPASLAIHRIVIAESGRFPELGEAFYENGPARVRQALGRWLAEQTRAGWLNVTDFETAAEQFIALVRAGNYLRATLGLPSDPARPGTEAAAEAAVDMFLRAYKI